MNIRKATAQEADQLSGIAFRAKAYWGYSDSFMESCRKELTYTSSQIENNAFHFSVIEKNKLIAGFYALEILSSTDIELDAMFIDPQYIGSGLGRELMEHAISAAKQLGANSITIQSEPNAESFYQHFGAITTGSRESSCFPDRRLPLLTLSL